MTTPMSNTNIKYEHEEYARDLKISSEGREKLTKLQDLPGSPFSDTDLKDLYVLAVAYGYQKDQVASIDATGSRALVQRKQLSDYQEVTMEAIAVDYEGSPLVLNDKKKVAEISQRHALGGLTALIEWCKDADNHNDEFLSMVRAAQQRSTI